MLYNIKKRQNIKKRENRMPTCNLLSGETNLEQYMRDTEYLP